MSVLTPMIKWTGKVSAFDCGYLFCIGVKRIKYINKSI